MQILIPMTGNGTRFKSAGYKRLKPFIKVHDKPIIHWISKMFSVDQHNITFICRKDHYQELSYFRKELNEAAPKAKVFFVEDWKKQGPAIDILKSDQIIDDEKPVLISYCDYFMNWDYPSFKKKLEKKDPDGAIPCYTGFHPHLIPKNNLYASCKVNKENYLLEIKEKYQVNKDKTKDLQSPGLYYFKSGNILKKYCREMVKAKDKIKDEYYMSLPFNYLVNDGLKVWCPSNVKYFCQWGTPEDLKEYLFWIETLKKRI
jgi:NDP-sugar pyrophosphorylase family protein